MTLPQSFIFDSANEADTARLGAALAAVLPSRAVVALNGPLGAGKTRLVQAVARASGVPPGEATSPTFVLINEYRGEGAIFHIDAYRLKDDDEFLGLGPEEYFARDGWTFIEWGERVERCLPRERLVINIQPVGDTQRRFEIVAASESWQAVVEKLAAALGDPL